MVESCGTQIQTILVVARAVVIILFFVLLYLGLGGVLFFALVGSAILVCLLDIFFIEGLEKHDNKQTTPPEKGVEICNAKSAGEVPLKEESAKSQ